MLSKYRVFILQNVDNVSLHPVDVNFSSYGEMAESGDGADVTEPADELLPFGRSSTNAEDDVKNEIGNSDHIRGNVSVPANGDQNSTANRDVVHDGSKGNLGVTKTNASASNRTAPQHTRGKIGTSTDNSIDLNTPAATVSSIGVTVEDGDSAHVRSTTASIRPAVTVPSSGVAVEDGDRAPARSTSASIHTTSDDTSSDVDTDHVNDLLQVSTVAQTGNNELNTGTEMPTEQSGLSWLFGIFSSFGNSAPETTMTTTTVASKTKGHVYHHFLWDGSQRDASWREHVDFYHRQENEDGVFIYDHNFFEYGSDDDDDDDFDLFADYNDILEGDDYETDRKIAVDSREDNEENSLENNDKEANEDDSDARDKAGSSIATQKGRHDVVIEPNEWEKGHRKKQGKVSPTEMNTRPYTETVAPTATEAVSETVLPTGSDVVTDTNGSGVISGTEGTTETNSNEGNFAVVQSGFGSGDGGCKYRSQWPCMHSFSVPEDAPQYCVLRCSTHNTAQFVVWSILRASASLEQRIPLPS
jgi:hypothetical protein